ncbi:hypothetical protein HPB47_003442, partial [Ixodes persulcatus]
PHHFKSRRYDTVVIKITNGLDLKDASHQKVGEAIMHAAQLIPGEKLEVFNKESVGSEDEICELVADRVHSCFQRLADIVIIAIFAFGQPLAHNIEPGTRHLMPDKKTALGEIHLTGTEEMAIETPTAH